ncbi:hypothetical protein IMG5_013170 [Ichthyophthirius multifiliis]|uniref:Uncharacterized protein n=1 Tax=Ichthyophthirius multifiliis TaxID=5932 RepID=G0QK54_ICHMU|nr:hypothetical protein IMG5_013170 [Ichthyophthirius multifiliis]EGR34398.1 hypothetical protein IMG5_013170 [Ichthyophthirius multifiliis]|eukprot:XP_004039702.1 hypothetical protein IMG5_013170 [Ichthyophthirius multifiliis]
MTYVQPIYVDNIPNKYIKSDSYIIVRLDVFKVKPQLNTRPKIPPKENNNI